MTTTMQILVKFLHSYGLKNFGDDASANGLTTLTERESVENNEYKEIVCRGRNATYREPSSPATSW